MSDRAKIQWYRSPLSKEDLKGLNTRNNRKAWVQTAGFGCVLCATGGIVLWSYSVLSWWMTGLLLFLHGTAARFLIPAMHELSHGTVFTSAKTNRFFMCLFSFFGWLNPFIFKKSHARHHQYTLHPPDDMEELPLQHPSMRQLLKTCFDPVGFFRLMRATFRHACGRVDKEWEETLFPDRGSRKEVIHWARTLLTGHGIILLSSVISGYWIIAVVLSLTPMYGGLLQVSLNHTQHAGLPGHINDWRVVARSVRVNPITGFLYWHMQYHIEHHMYAAVPCYNLKELHETIKNDLPVSPGLTDCLVSKWRSVVPKRV